jgi:hypothetical protein
MKKEKPPYDFEKDKLRLMFKDHKEIFNFFHIDFKTGIIYNKNLWDKGVPRECGRPIGKEYLRVSITKNGETIDVLAHRLIFYAYYGLNIYYIIYLLDNYYYYFYSYSHWNISY